MQLLAKRMLRTLCACGGTLTLVMSLPGVAGAQDTRVDAPLPHATGQSVSASYEGWYPNPDGTRSLVFGYFNRNYEEDLDIPVGEDNMFEPGLADRGQPTHFFPRRQTGVFAVVVPADFGDQRLTWSLTAHGETIKIPGHLEPGWEITDPAAVSSTAPASRHVSRTVPIVNVITSPSRSPSLCCAGASSPPCGPFPSTLPVP